MKKRQAWVETLLHWVGRKPQDKEDLADLVCDASDRAVLDTDSTRMIQGVLNVSDMDVDDVMIPRANMVQLSEDMLLSTALPIITESAHSRFPVTGENKNEVVGILLAKDVLVAIERKEESRLRVQDLIRPAMFIPESKRLDTLLQEFRAKRYHMAIVVDEYGSVSGLVTIEDVLEQIVGNIEDEYDHSADKNMIEKLAEGKYRVNALTPIALVNSNLNTHLSDEEYDTVGGLALEKLAHLPKAGECIVLGDYSVQVDSATDRRIESLIFTAKG